MIRVAATTLFAALVLVAPSVSAGTAMGGENCGKPVNITAKLVRSLEAPDESFPGEGKLPAFLLATHRGEFERTQFLFVKRDGRWRGWTYTTNASAEAVHVSARHGMAMMFGMWGVEGPGKAYTVLSTRDGFRTVQCNLLPQPKEPSNPNGVYTTTYMSIVGAEGDRHGRATISGEVEWEQDGRITRYASHAMLGRDWSVPVPATANQRVANVFTPLTSRGARRLLGDLRRSAGLRR